MDAASDALHYPHSHHRDRKIGEVLVDLGFTAESAIEIALNRASRLGLLTGQALIKDGHITGRQLARGLASSYGLPFLDYDEFPVDDRVLARVDPGVARKHMAVPCAMLDDGTVIVAIADSAMVTAIERLSSNTSRPVIYAVAQENDVHFMIRRVELLRAAAA